MLFQERNVFEEELFLQIFGAGGNDDALAGKNRGNQIRQRLAGAGAGFDDQVLLFGQSGFHRFRHLQLAVAKFVSGVPLGKQSFAAKELADGEGFGCGRHLLVDFSSQWRRRRGRSLRKPWWPPYFLDIATDSRTSH